MVITPKASTSHFDFVFNSQACATRKQARIDSGADVIVGVNKYTPLAGCEQPTVDPRVIDNRCAIWPLHNVAITNIVWCMAYKGGSGWWWCIAQ